MALLAASSSIACTSFRCVQASTHLARSAASCPPPQLPLPAAARSSHPLNVELGGTAMAAALFATLASTESAMAAQEMMSLAANDNRGIALLLPLIPAVGWVLFNILQPALNQIDRMRSAKGLVAGLGLGAAGSLLISSRAHAAVQEMASLADGMEAASSDARGLLLAASLVPALGWVLFNILQPALKQLDKMKAAKAIAATVGLGAAASALFPSRSDALQEISSIAAADSDSRGILLLVVLLPAVGWVLFNILQPAINQFDKMRAQK